MFFIHILISSNYEPQLKIASDSEKPLRFAGLRPCVDSNLHVLLKGGWGGGDWSWPCKTVQPHGQDKLEQTCKYDNNTSIIVLLHVCAKVHYETCPPILKPRLLFK